MSPREFGKMSETEHALHFIEGFLLAEPPDTSLIEQGLIPSLSADQLLMASYRLDALLDRIRSTLSDRARVTHREATARFERQFEAETAQQEAENVPPDAHGLRDVSIRDGLRIGRGLGDMLVAYGHPLTCNGGNPDFKTHHNSEVILKLNADDNLVCPQCGRVQELPARWRERYT